MDHRHRGHGAVRVPRPSLAVKARTQIDVRNDCAQAGRIDVKLCPGLLPTHGRHHSKACLGQRDIEQHPNGALVLH